MASPAVAKLSFQCYAPIGFGESLVVTGDTPILGADDPALGVELTTSAAAYPVWTTPAPVAVFARQTVRYRYAVFRGGAHAPPSGNLCPWTGP